MSELVVTDLKQAIRQQLEGVIALSPEHGEAIDAIWKNVRLMAKANDAMVQALAEAGVVIDGALAMATEMEKQRDAIATEYGNFIQELKADDFMKASPQVRDILMGIYSNAEEAAHDEFYSALPYQMAHALGGEWDFMTVDNLKDLLTIDMDEEDPEDYGLTEDQLLTFRTELYKLYQSVMGGD